MIYILLPAFNEEDALRPMAEKLERVMKELGTPYRVVVVNDGSKDRTAEILEAMRAEYPLDVVTHKYNRGLGETIRDGFEFINERASPDDVVVRMDCDDTHEPRYIPVMLKKLQEGYDVVIASRYQPGGGVEGLDLYRRTISRIANLIFKAAFPIRGIWEYTCGYRAYRATIIQDALQVFGNRFVGLKGLGFTGTLEKLVKLRMLGARFAEVPFVLRYDQKMSQSKVVASVTTFGCFALILKQYLYEGDRWNHAIEERKARAATKGTAKSST